MFDINDILDTIDDIIIITDSENNVIYNNKNYEQFANLIETKHTGEIYIIDHDKWYNIHHKKITKNNSNFQVFVIKDITKYKQKERLLERERISDCLTGLYNRKGIEFNIEKAIKAFKKSNQPFTIVIGDIDHFKNINDTYGHLAGDMVLCKISDILSKSLRKDDFVGRYGGEEFMIVIKNDKIDKIIPRINQIKQNIEQFTFLYDNNIIKLTMTFGLQIYDGTKCIDQVIKEADTALYHGKENGRNLTVFYEDIKDK